MYQSRVFRLVPHNRLLRTSRVHRHWLSICTRTPDIALAEAHQPLHTQIFLPFHSMWYRHSQSYRTADLRHLEAEVPGIHRQHIHSKWGVRPEVYRPIREKYILTDPAHPHNKFHPL